MADKAMKERHWKRIEEITKHTFDVESEGFALQNVMEAPLLPNMDDIEVMQGFIQEFYLGGWEAVDLISEVSSCAFS